MFNIKSGNTRDRSSKPSVLLLEAFDQTHMVLTCALDGTVESANAEFFKISGFDAASVEGKPYKQFVREKDFDEFDALWRDVCAGQPINKIVPRLDSDKEEIWYDVTYAPAPDVEGAVEKVYVIAREISEMHLRRRDNRGKVDAVARSMAVIEFDLEGNILHANDLFLGATGYALDEIVGKHHKIFMPDGEGESEEYKTFWRRLGRGSSEKGQVKRVNKAGETLWLEATYETIYDPEGRPFKVVKYAFDITDVKNASADAQGQIDAIQKVQAVIEFEPDGTIRRANENFCNAVGYDESEIVGKHHRMFVDPAYGASDEYREFWETLASGQAIEDEFERVGKGGKRITIRASYNPVKNAAGEVFKVAPFTFTPIDRAVPATIFMADSIVNAFKSGILSSAIAFTWSQVMVATFLA